MQWQKILFTMVFWCPILAFATTTMQIQRLEPIRGNIRFEKPYAIYQITHPSQPIPTNAIKFQLKNTTVKQFPTRIWHRYYNGQWQTKVLLDFSYEINHRKVMLKSLIRPNRHQFFAKAIFEVNLQVKSIDAEQSFKDNITLDAMHPLDYVSLNAKCELTAPFDYYITFSKEQIVENDPQGLQIDVHLFEKPWNWTLAAYQGYEGSEIGARLLNNMVISSNIPDAKIQTLGASQLKRSYRLLLNSLQAPTEFLELQLKTPKNILIHHTMGNQSNSKVAYHAFPNAPKQGCGGPLRYFLSSDLQSQTMVLPIARQHAYPEGEFNYSRINKKLRFMLTNKNANTAYFTDVSQAELISEANHYQAPLTAISTEESGFLFDNVVEGQYTLKAGIYANGVFSNGKPYVMLQYPYLVKSSAPVVKQVKYQPKSGAIVVKASDKGTPLDQLTGKLTIKGKVYSLKFSKGGEAIVPYPQLLQKTSVTVIVEDLAKQSSRPKLVIIP